MWDAAGGELLVAPGGRKSLDTILDVTQPLVAETARRTGFFGDKPVRFLWLHQRGALPAAVWHYQRLHGRRYYRRHLNPVPVSSR